MDEAEATREVAEKWVQWASTATSQTWVVSPDGLRELIAQGKIRNTKKNMKPDDHKSDPTGNRGDEGQSWAKRTGPTNPDPMKRTGRTRSVSDPGNN